MFQVWLLTYYFYFSNKADKFCFFLEPLFSLCYLSKEAPIVKDFDFMGNKICHNFKNSFIENRDFLINTLVRKSSFPVKLGSGTLVRSLIAS